MKSVLKLFSDTIRAYLGDRAAIYAAGLAYYAVFAIAPLVVLVGSMAGLLVGQQIASSQIFDGIQYFVGPELAGFLVQVAAAVSERTFSTSAALVSVVGLLLSGAGIFSQLDTALNDLWGITTLRPGSLRDRLTLIRHKLGPFVLVFFLGLLLSASVLINTALGSISSLIARLIPGIPELQPQTSWILIPFLTFLTFGAIFKWLPDARSRWRDVAVGALVTTILFLIGRWVLNFYLQRNDTPSLFGAASSLIVLLIWVDVSAHIVLFGAEFTKLYADRFGQPIIPRRLATFVDTAQTTELLEPAANPDDSVRDA